MLHSSTGETPFLLLYGRDATYVTIYSDYGTVLFKELKFIHEVARKKIQQAQLSQKNTVWQIYTRPVTIQVGNTVVINEQYKLIQVGLTMDHYCVHEVNDTNVKVKPVT